MRFYPRDAGQPPPPPAGALPGSTTILHRLRPQTWRPRPTTTQSTDGPRLAIAPASTLQTDMTPRPTLLRSAPEEMKSFLTSLPLAASLVGPAGTFYSFTQVEPVVIP